VPFWTCEAKFVFFMSPPHHHRKTTGKVWDVEDMRSDMPNNIEYTSQHCANFGVASFSYSFSYCPTCVVISFLCNICKFGQKRIFQSYNNSCKGLLTKRPKSIQKIKLTKLKLQWGVCNQCYNNFNLSVVPWVLALCFPKLKKKLQYWTQKVRDSNINEPQHN
jgi:hypothetical protein